MSLLVKNGREWFQPQMRNTTQWISQLRVKGDEFEVLVL